MSTEHNQENQEIEAQTTEEITESGNTENVGNQHSSRDRDESDKRNVSKRNVSHSESDSSVESGNGESSNNGTGSNTDEPVDNSDDTEGGKVHREAAKYRTQLRETETQLETITGQRNQLAQQVIENNLGNLKPAVFWKLAGDVTDYIKDDGTVNLEKVTKTAKTIGDDLGINAGPTIPGQEKRPGKINAGNKLHQAFEPK